MKAYHFLKANMRAGIGREKPWAEGEERSIKGHIAICQHGYHWSKSWYDALRYAPGPVACIVDVDRGTPDNDGKGVSRRRKLLKAISVERELRLFACLCAERALKGERRAGKEPDTRCWEAIKVARRFASGRADKKELAAARSAAWAAASEAARDAASEAAWAAARDTATRWQRRTINRMLNTILDGTLS